MNVPRPWFEPASDRSRTALGLNLAQALSQQVRDDLRLVRSIEHPGEGGRGRENIMADFLRHFLPRGYEISSGFIIDASGNKSRQMDLVVHYAERHPVFEIAGVKHFLAEAVVAVIENKATITSGEELLDALDTIVSAKRLNREFVGPARKLPLHPSAPEETSDRFARCIFGAITTERLPSVSTVQRAITDFLAAEEHRWFWPNLLVAIDPDHELVVSYGGPGPDGGKPQTVDPFQATVLTTSRGSKLPHAPLVYLAFEIANAIRTVAVYDYSPRAYLLGDDFGMDEWPLLPPRESD